MIYAALFLVGICELFLDLLDFKATQWDKIWLSSLLSVLDVWFWYLIVRIIVNRLTDLGAVSIYSLGCGLGCFIGMKFFRKYRNRKNNEAGTLPNR